MTCSMHILSWEYSKEHLESTSNGFVVYNVTIQPLEKQFHEYTIRRRYSQFYQLARDLQQEGFHVPQLPIGNLWMNLRIFFLPHSSLEQRQTALQCFLDKINSVQDIQLTDAMQNFIGGRPDAQHGYTSLFHFSPTSERMIQLHHKRKPQRRRSI